MKTTAIFTRTLTTNTVSAFDLVRQGWQIVSIDIDGGITATKQQLVNCDKDAAMSNMMRHNLCDSNKEYGTEIVSKIDFGVYKVGLVWNTDTRRAEAWMHHPEVNKEYSKGLMFVSNGDGTCSVFKIGTCTDTNVEIPSVYDGEIVTSIDAYAFEGCTGLTSVTIPDSVVSIGQGAFEGCSRLKSITLPFVGASFNETSHTNFGYIFGALSYCLNSSYVPASLKTVAITGGLSIGEGAFSDCYGLTSITIPDSVTSIGEGAFRYCPRLTSITIPDSVTSIGSNTFNGCFSLTSVTIPDNVTSIGNYAFYNCSRLTSITIPDSVTSIGNYVFYGCDNLKSIIMGNGISSKF